MLSVELNIVEVRAETREFLTVFAARLPARAGLDPFVRATVGAVLLHGTEQRLGKGKVPGMCTHEVTHSCTR